MALPGNVQVADEFRIKPIERAQSLQTRLDQKRNLTKNQTNPNALQPSVPDWLQASHPLTAIPQQDNNYAQTLSDQNNDVNALGTAANGAVASGLEYRQRQAAARALAESQARAERNQDFLNGIGNIDLGDLGGASGSRAEVIRDAEKLLGTPYSWGGGHGAKAGPSYGFAQGAGIKGVDCSGLVRYAFAKAGITKWGKAATSQIQSTYGRVAPIKSLLPGDLVVRGAQGKSHHVAIYLGNGKIIEAQQTGTRVHIRSIKGEGGWYGIHLSY
jgi:cell wall-associated NlpC family hydrolase